MIKAEVYSYNIDNDSQIKISDISPKNRHSILSKVEIMMDLSVPMFLLFEVLKSWQWEIYALKPILEKDQEIFYVPDNFIKKDEVKLKNSAESELEQSEPLSYYNHGLHKAIASYHWLKALGVHDSQANAVFPQSQMVVVSCSPTLMVLLASLVKWKTSTPELRLLRQSIINAMAQLEGQPFKETLKYVQSINPPS